MKRVLFLILVLFFTSIPAYPRLLESMLKDGIGVRPLGMGGAVTAMPEDPCGMFYNPASIGRKNFEYLHGYLDPDKIIYNSAEYSIVNLRNFSIANWFYQDAALGRLETTAIGFSQHTGGIAYGLTMKNCYGTTSDETVAGYSFDVGLQGRFSESVLWGLNFQDIYEVNLNIPASIRASLAFNFGTSVLVIEGEGRNLKDPKASIIYPHVGFEAVLSQGFIARVGYDKNYYTGGFSITVPVVDIEYAIAIEKDAPEKSSVHRFGFRFGKDGG